IALHAHSYAVVLAQKLEELGYQLSSKCFFDTIEVIADAARVEAIAEKNEINLFYPTEDKVRLSMDEVVTIEELNKIITIFAEAASKPSPRVTEVPSVRGFCPSMNRQTPFLTETIFNRYSSETDMMRYIKKLETRDISLATSMISLGSCTMKLNSATSMMPLSWSEFGNVHPFVPFEQAAGYHEMMNELSSDLAVITGFAAVS
ncbi:MAG: glycine dehydrogenase (aminomethyl-transferring), partial [Rikenellaceae bacterium]